MLKVDDVIAFLNTIGSLKKYIDVFHEEEIDGSALVETIAKDKDDLWLCIGCLLYTSPSPRDATLSRMPSSA